ncbi:unnamed protein product, partial [Staurois parvus]
FSSAVLPACLTTLLSLPPATRHWRRPLPQLRCLGGRDLVPGCVKSIPTIRGPGEGQPET